MAERIKTTNCPPEENNKGIFKNKNTELDI